MPTRVEIPDRVQTLEDFKDWMRLESLRWAPEIAQLLDERRDQERLEDDVGRALDDMDAYATTRDASLKDGLQAVVSRYEAMRGVFAEWHDYDVSGAAEGYEERLTEIMRAAAEHDDFRYRVRRALRDTGALADEDDDNHAVALLRTMLGVEL